MKRDPLLPLDGYQTYNRLGFALLSGILRAKNTLLSNVLKK
jgi:hypothetical protein